MIDSVRFYFYNFYIIAFVNLKLIMVSLKNKDAN